MLIKCAKKMLDSAGLNRARQHKNTLPNWVCGEGVSLRNQKISQKHVFLRGA